MKLETVSTTFAMIPLLCLPDARLPDALAARLLAPDEPLEMLPPDLDPFLFARELVDARPEVVDLELLPDLDEVERDDPLFEEAEALPDLDPDELDFDLEEPTDEDFEPEELREGFDDEDELPDLEDLPELAALDELLELPDREDEPDFLAPEDLPDNELVDFLDEADLLLFAFDEPEREPDRDAVDFFDDDDDLDPEAFFDPADFDDEDLDPDDFFVPGEDFDREDLFVAGEDLEPDERFVAVIILFPRNVFISCDLAQLARSQNGRLEYSNPRQTLITRH
jgi:hypothetical protein